MKLWKQMTIRIKKLSNGVANTFHLMGIYIGSDFSKKQATDLFGFAASNGLKWKTTQHKNGSNYRFFQSPVSSNVQDVDVHFYAADSHHTRY
jgi:hypothetical protein